MQILEPRGTLVLKSTYYGEPPVELARIVINEWNVVGSRCGLFAPALELLKSKAVDVTSLITGRFPLSDGVQAMHIAANSESMKVLLFPEKS